MNQKNPTCGTFGFKVTEGPWLRSLSGEAQTAASATTFGCPSQSNKVKAKAGLCRQEQSTKNSSLEDTVIVVQGIRHAPSRLQGNGAASRGRSMVKSGREARAWLPSLSSHPRSHSLSSRSCLSSSTCSLLPLTQREQKLLQGWNQIMQTTLLIFKNKYKRESMLIWPGTWLSPSVLLLFPS